MCDPAMQLSADLGGEFESEATATLPTVGLWPLTQLPLRSDFFFFLRELSSHLTESETGRSVFFLNKQFHRKSI